MSDFGRISLSASDGSQTAEAFFARPTPNCDRAGAWGVSDPGQQRLPQGTRLEAVAHYDNSAFNPYNPDPTRTVPYGLQTYDEMFNGYGFYVSDDEDLNLNIDPKLGAVRR